MTRIGVHSWPTGVHFAPIGVRAVPDDRPFGPRSCRVERDAKTHRILAPRISPPVVMGFAALNPSLYQRESLQCDRSVRNDPARVATWAGSPIVGSQPIAAFEG